MIYNVVLVSGVQQVESVMHIHIYSLRFVSDIGHYKVVSRVPCAIQEVLISYLFYIWGFPGGTSGKEPACQCSRPKRLEFYPWVGRIPWRRAWQPIPMFLVGASHGQTVLVGYGS